MDLFDFNHDGEVSDLERIIGLAAVLSETNPDVEISVTVGEDEDYESMTHDELEERLDELRTQRDTIECEEPDDLDSEAGNVKKCAVGKHPKSEKHGNTAQFSEVERSGTQENCGGIGSGCRLHLRPLPVLHRRQSQRVARIDPNAVVVDKNIAENDRFDLFSR